MRNKLFAARLLLAALALPWPAFAQTANTSGGSSVAIGTAAGQARDAAAAITAEAAALAAANAKPSIGTGAGTARDAAAGIAAEGAAATAVTTEATRAQAAEAAITPSNAVFAPFAHRVAHNFWELCDSRCAITQIYINSPTPSVSTPSAATYKTESAGAWVHRLRGPDSPVFDLSKGYAGLNGATLKVLVVPNSYTGALPAFGVSSPLIAGNGFGPQLQRLRHLHGRRDGRRARLARRGW